MTMTQSTFRSMNLRTFAITSGIIALAFLGQPSTAQTKAAPSQATADSLKSGFVNPPQSARPRVW